MGPLVSMFASVSSSNIGCQSQHWIIRTVGPPNLGSDARLDVRVTVVLVFSSSRFPCNILYSPNAILSCALNI